MKPLRNASKVGCCKNHQSNIANGRMITHSIKGRKPKGEHSCLQVQVVINLAEKLSVEGGHPEYAYGRLFERTHNYPIARSGGLFQHTIKATITRLTYFLCNARQDLSARGPSRVFVLYTMNNQAHKK